MHLVADSIQDDTYYLHIFERAHTSCFTSGLHEVLLFSESQRRAQENRYKLKKNPLPQALTARQKCHQSTPH
jgi:hypothetical protein